MYLPGGESNPVSRVTGGDTHHYTTEDTIAESQIDRRVTVWWLTFNPTLFLYSSVSLSTCLVISTDYDILLHWRHSLLDNIEISAAHRGLCILALSAFSYYLDIPDFANLDCVLRFIKFINEAYEQRPSLHSKKKKLKNKFWALSCLWNTGFLT